MLRSDRKLVLIDFGQSKHVKLPGVRKPSSFGVSGTSGWVPWNAHDMCTRSDAHDPLKVDVFSLAQVVIAIVFQKPPDGPGK